MEDERAEAAVAAALKRIESGQPVTAGWLRDQFPDCWESAIEALELVRSEDADGGARVLGPYRLLRKLGSGGMGSVWLADVTARARDLEPGTRVAVKVVHEGLLDKPGAFKRFLREAEVGRSVDHANVVRTYDVDALVERGRQQHFLVMEYVEGQTLRALLTEMGTVPEELCRHIGREVAKGLAAIHAAGAVHRDIKPENVLITKDEVVKVMDLGVARLIDESMRLSQTGAFIGTLRYAAPEQLKGGSDLDGRTDVYALGLVLYELATGICPFVAEDYSEVIRRVLHEIPRSVAVLNPQLSPFFEHLVATLVHKDPEKRLASAKCVQDALEAGESGTWWRQRAGEIRTETKKPLRRIRIPRETAVYGRESEIEQLRALFEKSKAGDGQVAFVVGEAGIGKSRLVDELVGLLERDGADVNFLVGGYPPGGAATASGAFTSAYHEHFGDDEAAIRVSLPEQPLLVPAFAAHLRGDTPPAGTEPLTKDSLLTVFVRAAQSLAKDRPTIVLIEDLHFAPDEGRALFASLALGAPGHRLFLIGTSRPGLDAKWVANLDRLGHTTHVDLKRLGPKDLMRLLVDAFRSERLAEELSFRVAAKSDGNPFFVFEILRGLRESGVLTKSDDGSWQSTSKIEDLKIPSTVLELVQARLGGLSDDDRNLLEVASCVGFEFDPRLVATVVGTGAIPTLQRLGRVEKAHGLVRSAGARFMFDHHQVQEALYEGLSQPLREEYHAAIGNALEVREQVSVKGPMTLDGALCVNLCEQFLKGAQGERALRYFAAAHAHLEKGYLNDAAIRLAVRALAVPGLLTGVDRANALLRLGGSNGPLDRLGRRERQQEAAREADRLAEELGDPELRGQAKTSLGTVLWRTSCHAEAEAAFRAALETATVRGDRKAEAGAMGNLGNVFYSQGRLAEAKEHTERCLALSCEIGDRMGEANATGNLGNIFYSQGRLAEAKEHLDRHLALSREIGDRRGEANATGNLGNVFHDQGHLAEAKEHDDRHLALSREIGDRQGEATATGNLGAVFQSQGRLAEAKEHLDRHLALSREIGDRQGEARATGNVGAVFHAQGRLADAKERLELHLRLSREIGDRKGEANAQHNLGIVLREMGDPAGSEERYLSCLAISVEIGHRRAAAATHLALGSLRASLLSEEAARASLTAARDLARAVGRPGVETLARCELSLLPGGEPSDALAAFSVHEERLTSEDRLEARHLLWRATGDRVHLAEAKRLLDESVANVPEDIRASMLVNLPVNREIVAACKEAGL